MLFLSRSRRAALMAMLVLLTLGSSATPAIAAAPRVMLVYGPPLARPVILHDWDENARLMLAVADTASTTPAALTGRPYLGVALFWGMQWVRYVRQGKPLVALHPEQANQCARFYPAYGTAPPIWAFGTIPGYAYPLNRVSPAGIAILARHGIPVRMKPGTKPPVSTKPRCTER